MPNTKTVTRAVPSVKQILGKSADEIHNAAQQQIEREHAQKLKELAAQQDARARLQVQAEARSHSYDARGALAPVRPQEPTVRPVDPNAPKPGSTSLRPFFEGQQPDHYIIPSMGPGAGVAMTSKKDVGGSAIPVYVYGESYNPPDPGPEQISALDRPTYAEAGSRDRLSPVVQAVGEMMPGVATARHFSGQSNDGFGGTIGAEAINVLGILGPDELMAPLRAGRAAAKTILEKTAARSEVKAAIEASRAPDSGFTLTPLLHPDQGRGRFIVAYGAYEVREKAPLTERTLLAFRNAHLDLLKSDPSLRIGGWHNPEDGQVYLDISRTFDSHDEAMQFAREQGQLSIYDRANPDASLPTGLTPDSADTIKAGLHEVARLQGQAGKYDSLLARAHEVWGGKVPKSGKLSPAQERETEKYMNQWAEMHPGPEADAFYHLQYEAHLARNAPDPETLFKSDDLVQSIADAHGIHVDRKTLMEKYRGTDLKGLPPERASNKTAQSIADQYMKDAGLPYKPPRDYAKVDPDRAERIAAWYDQAVSAPDDPAVRASYEAMIRETKAQYDAITREGYRFEFYPKEDPYPTGPSQAIDDLRANQHMYVFPTSEGFGSGGPFHVAPRSVRSSIEKNGLRPGTLSRGPRGVYFFDDEKDAAEYARTMTELGHGPYDTYALKDSHGLTLKQDPLEPGGGSTFSSGRVDSSLFTRREEHPLLADSGVRWGGEVVTHNDLFRAVHDYMGHFKEGVGFRADGEENAWRAHSAMYSEEARPAMTAETRGQNSWVNYGPHGEANKTADQAATVYADQKAVIAPEWVVNDGAPEVVAAADPMLEAAAMQATQGGTSIEDAAKMFGLDPEALRAHIEGDGHDAEQARILSNADVGGGAAETTEDAKTILDRLLNEERGSLDPWSFYKPGQSAITTSADELAKQHGVDLTKVVGTGTDGRVTVPDVEKYVFEQMSPEDQLRSLMHGLRSARGKQEAGYSVERRARFNKAADQLANENGTPEERLAAAKGELAGELPKVIVNGKARLMTQDAVDSLMTTVMQHGTLMTGQKIKVADALNKLIKEGRTPTKGELALMQHVWGRDTVGSLQDIATNWHKVYNTALSAINIPRAIMSSMDVSFGLRQALVAAAYDPKTWWKAYREQFKYLSKYTGGGEEAYQALMHEIHERPNFPLYQEMGLAITDLEAEIGLREEPYNSNLAEKLTIKGHGPGNAIRGSGRAYTGMAVKLRTELADKLLAQAAAQGKDIHNEQLLHEIGHFINGITGRGDLPGKVLKESAPLLNTLFFSPRLLASRLQMLNPRNYILGDDFVRRQYIRAGLGTFGTLLTILAAIKFFVPGVEVGTDWRSSDFGKVKIGDTRIDPAGGFNQLFHLMGMIYTGQKKSSTTGKVSSLTSNKFGQATRMDAFVNFLSGKLAPVPSMVNDWGKNKDPMHVGEPFNWKDEAASHFQPLIIQDSWSIYNDPVAGLNGIEAAIAGYGLAAQGVGVQTYSAGDVAKKPKDKLVKQAKEAGLPAPPQEVLISVEHKVELDSISRDNPGDPMGKMKGSLEYYAKVTGDHSYDDIAKRIEKAKDEKSATTLYENIRTWMIGKGVGQYEAAIKKSGVK